MADTNTYDGTVTGTTSADGHAVETHTVGPDMLPDPDPRLSGKGSAWGAGGER